MSQSIPETFDGKRMRQVRRAKGYTQEGWGGYLGRSRISVFNWEKKNKSPSDDVFERLHLEFGIPRDYFFKNRPGLGTKPVHYRSRASAAAKEREVAEWHLEHLFDIHDEVGGYFDLPKLELPSLVMPPDPSKLHAAVIEQAAEATRRAWGVREGPIEDLVGLAEDNGFVVSRVMLDTKRLDGLSINVGNKFVFTILAADKRSSVRSRHDLAHEIGHAVLHHQVPKELLKDSEAFKEVERQAAHFAGALLFPAAEFVEAAYPFTLATFRRLKMKWGVSIGAMAMRAKQLERVSDLRARKMFITMSKRGWRTREPLDDVLDIEKPWLLKSTIQTLFQEEIVSPNMFIHDLALPADEVEFLAGLPPGFFDKHSTRRRDVRSRLRRKTPMD